MYQYAEVYGRLSFEVATLVFMKKDGTFRVMLATRNARTAELVHGFLGGKLNSRDSHCNINNGNIAVIDLALGEIRSFSVDRLVGLEYHGAVNTKEELEKITEQYLTFKRNYEAHEPQVITMDMLD